MPKKDTNLIQLSEKIHITVEETKNPGVEIPDHMFLKIYTEQACSAVSAALSWY